MEYVIGLDYTPDPRVSASLGIMEENKYIQVHGDVPENFKIVKEWPSDFVESVEKILKSGPTIMEGLHCYIIPAQFLQQITAEIGKLNPVS